MSPVAAPADRRFRRVHTKPSRRRSRWKVLVRMLAIYGAVVMVGSYGAYLATAAVSRADLLRIDEVLVQGNHRMPSGEVLAILEGLRGEHILWTDLDAWRMHLLASPWVQQATLRRSLPSTIEVTVIERTPMAIARLRQNLYLVDDRGVVIDAYGPPYADLDLPIVDGLALPASADAKGAPVAVATDEIRAALAASVILALQPRPDLARRLSQIDVSDRHNVAVILAGDPAVISVGTERFLPRLQSYVELAATLRERVPDIDHVDLRFDDRIYVRPGRASQGSGPLTLSRASGPPAQARVSR